MPRRVKLVLPGQDALVSSGFCAPCEAEKLQAQTKAITERQMNRRPAEKQPIQFNGPPPVKRGGLTLTQRIAKGLRLAVEEEPVEEVGGEDPPESDPTSVRWSGIICREGELTGDGRMIDNGALVWEDLPLPLRWDVEDDGAHAGAVVIGLITDISRDSNGDIRAAGIIDLVGDYGWEAARLCAKGMLRGVSIDPDDVDYEIRLRGDLYDAMVEMFEPIDEEAEPEDESDGDGEDPDSTEDPDEPKRDEEGRVTVYEGQSDDEVMVMTHARIRAATMVDTPAIAAALIALDEELPEQQPTTEASEEAESESGEQPVSSTAAALVAAGNRVAPERPPASWFADPKLGGPTPLTVTPDGRVFGHLALWDSCHLGYESCVKPPKSASNYAWFRTGVLIADDGSEVPVGQITVGTGHASLAASAYQAVAHYDNTGRAVVDVSAGEDRHGIWLAGAVRPTATEEQIRTLRASSPSGDWRRIGRSQELTAVLGVNQPGFPVPRNLVASGHVSGGRTDALILQGSPIQTATHPGPRDVAIDPNPLTGEEMAELRALVASGRKARDDEAHQLMMDMELAELDREMGAV